MTQRVIYVSFIRLTDKVARDWYIEHLIAHGLSVEFWDVTAFVRESFEEHHALSAGYARRIHSISELASRLTLPENLGAVYVMMISLEARFLPVFLCLSRHNCRMVNLTWGAMPLPPVLAAKKFLQLLKSPALLAKKIADHSKLKVAKKLGLVRPPDAVFAAGRVFVENQAFAQRVIPVNLFDYDHYIRLRDGERIVKDDRFAVFLDINLPYQSDLAICGLAAVDPHRYFKSMNRFFSLLESKFKMKVVVAAHPKSNYGPGAFESRVVLRGVTAQLVRDAEVVVAHTSTALSYAVLNSKPVIFVYTEEMADIYGDTVIRELQSMAIYLDSALVNVDEIRDCADIVFKAVDAGRYQKYKYDYLTSKASEHATTADIFLRELSVM